MLSLTALTLALAPLLRAACPPDQLVVYRLDLRTYWDEATFPKQYPQWRPSAQWSKTVGYSHDSSLTLFAPGAPVDEGIRQFAETGATEVLDRRAHNRTFLDAILGPPILEGVGHSATNVFVDGNHSLVSVVTKIVPSPDWFIGLHGLQLCQEGAFMDTFTTEAVPLDAGTDNGFTFTSPNWETEPRAEVFAMTSQFPAHPAGSFHYPHLQHLPRLAQYSLTKLREYTMQEDFTSKNTRKKGSKYQYEVLDGRQAEETLEFVPMEVTKASKQATVEKKERKVVEEKKVSSIMSNQIPRYRSSKAPVGGKTRLSLGGRRVSKGFRSPTSARGYHASTSPDSFLKKRYSSALLEQAQSRVFPGQADTKAALYNQILASYGSQRKGKIQSKHKKRRFRKKKRKRKKKARNCHVSAWGTWGSCSKTCGIGESVRVRTVRQTARHGGSPCPALIDYRWCGSARNCKAGYFKW